MKMYCVDIDGFCDEYVDCGSCFTDEVFFSRMYDCFCDSRMSFGSDCESCREYAEWFWDFYGEDLYDDFDENAEYGCEYKVVEYIF